jgi:hypothetical protein
MELAGSQQDLLAGYLRAFDPLIGDRRTGELLDQTVLGIISSESLVAARIASHSPVLAAKSHNGAQRVRRMASGDTTKRSYLDAEHLVARLQERGVEQLRDESEVWVIVDPSELRKPYAHEMENLMKVRALEEGKTVAGYRTLNALGIGRGGKRGIVYHRLFSSTAPDFDSESFEIQRGLSSIGEALGEHRGTLTYITDSQFDDIAVWGTIWEQGNHLVCRLKHQDRRVEVAQEQPEEGEPIWVQMPIGEAKGQVRRLARVRTEMLVRKQGQKYKKRQPVNVVIGACGLRVRYQVDVRTRGDGEVREQDAWLVLVELENVDSEPWLLLTDWPITTAQDAKRVFTMYRERWAVEDAFKFTKDVLGWEDVQLLNFEGVRTLVALAWVAAGFLYELGLTLEWPEVHLLARLGGFEEHKDRLPGKVSLTRGLQRMLDLLATEAILYSEIAQYGQLPPRLAALIGWTPKGPR